MIVDADLHIVHFQGDVSPYLAPATGQPSFHLLKMVRPELVVDLRTAIYKARKENTTVRKEDVQFEYLNKPAAFRLEVRPIQARNGRKADFIVVFQRVEPAGSSEAPRTGAKAGAKSAGRKHTPDSTEKLER